MVPRHLLRQVQGLATCTARMYARSRGSHCNALYTARCTHLPYRYLPPSASIKHPPARLRVKKKGGRRKRANNALIIRLFANPSGWISRSMYMVCRYETEYVHYSIPDSHHQGSRRQSQIEYQAGKGKDEGLGKSRKVKEGDGRTAFPDIQSRSFLAISHTCTLLETPSRRISTVCIASRKWRHEGEVVLVQGALVSIHVREWKQRRQTHAPRSIITDSKQKKGSRTAVPTCPQSSHDTVDSGAYDGGT